MDKNSKIFVAGHKGMLGTSIVDELRAAGFTNLLLVGRDKIDLCNGMQVEELFKTENPDYVILAAAKVGGINANMQFPVEFLSTNLSIQLNVISNAYKYKVKKLVFIGSSCIYPKDCIQPMKEEFLMDGKLEPTNEGYALAKITGYKLLQYYKTQYGFNSISLMPCNLYGPKDSFDPDHSHVLSALVKKISDAKRADLPNVSLWGTGVARREFMNVKDAAKAIIFFMQNREEQEFLNIGCGKDISIKDLAELIAKMTGYKGKLEWDASKPNGMLRKCLDVSKMTSLGFTPAISIESGIEEMIKIYEQKLNCII